MKLYKVKGNVGGTSQNGNYMYITVHNIYNNEQAPVMLEVLGNFKDYINELNGGDSEERYAKKVFYYDWFCTLMKIEVLDENGKVVKTVEADWLNYDWTK